jgi:hypothetical protein
MIKVKPKKFRALQAGREGVKQKTMSGILQKKKKNRKQCPVLQMVGLLFMG